MSVILLTMVETASNTLPINHNPPRHQRNMQINPRLRRPRRPPSPTRNHPLRRMYHVASSTSKDITRNIELVWYAG